MNRRDPRIRQTLSQFQSNIETANINVQVSLYDFAQQYVTPCMQSISTCLEDACGPCFAPRRARSRPRHHLAQGNRPEANFDFYNDFWEEEEEATESTGLLSGWGAPDLDRLLAGTNSNAGGNFEQPGRHAAMNYGSRGPPSAGLAPSRGRSGAGPKGGEVNANQVPSSSMFGFLESLPWKIGRRGLKYKPSAATLQENPHRKALRDPLLDELEEDADDEARSPPPRQSHHRRGLSAVIAGRGEAGGVSDSSSRAAGPSRPHLPPRHHSDQSQKTPPPSSHIPNRKRSGTSASHATTTSLSSRGDLFPSEDEDDAIPLDDEFATALERRTTSSNGRRRSSGAEGEGTSTSNSGSGMRSPRSNGGSSAALSARVGKLGGLGRKRAPSGAVESENGVDILEMKSTSDAERDEAEVLAEDYPDRADEEVSASIEAGAERHARGAEREEQPALSTETSTTPAPVTGGGDVYDSGNHLTADTTTATATDDTRPESNGP